MLADQNNMDGASENTEGTNSQLWFQFLDKLVFHYVNNYSQKNKQNKQIQVIYYFHIQYYTKTLFFTLQSVHPNIQARTIDEKKHLFCEDIKVKSHD